jgi:signal peptidase II
MAVPRNRYLAFFTIAVLGLLADLWTKGWIFGVLGPPTYASGSPVWWLWEGRIGFQTSLNEGALFGMGQGGVWVFASLSVVAAICVVVWFFRGGAAGSLWLTVALAAITAGILGNLYDRLALHGLRREGTWPGESGPAYAVRDWILVMIGDFHWPNFNIADSLLVAGAIMLVWHGLRATDQPETSDRPETSSDPPSK